MPHQELEPGDLFRRCDPEGLGFETTDELASIADPVGQERALESIRFGLEIDQDGFNVFALGPEGTGKRGVVLDLLRRRAAGRPAPDDWCYVDDFADPRRPRALRLPAGRGGAFRRRVDRLLEEVLEAIGGAFEGEDYRQERHEVEQAIARERDQRLESLRADARDEGLAVVRTPLGILFLPVRDDEPLSPSEIQQLPVAEREAYEAKARELGARAERVLESGPETERRVRHRIVSLHRRMAEAALRPLVAAVRSEYADLPAVAAHLEALEADLIDHADGLLAVRRQVAGGAPESGDDLLHPSFETPQRGESSGALPLEPDGPAPLRRYRVNLLVEHDPVAGAPVVYEDNPHYQNLIGRVENLARMGALVTDFNLIQPGALHRANGGYLVLDVHRVLMHVQAWEGLKRALRGGRIRIEPLGHALGLISTVQLEPEPIPFEAKVVFVGHPAWYHLLRALDPDFADLFKVPAEFEDRMPRDPDQERLLSHLVATIARLRSLRPFAREAVARVVEHASRLAGDASKLSVDLRRLADLLGEADHWAGAAGGRLVRRADVDRAIASQRERAGATIRRVQEAIDRGTLRVDVAGAAVGQVNGLSVFPFGDHLFGRPVRITARARLGNGHVVDIEREVELGSPIHSKGVLILAGFLGGRYATDLPLSLAASIVFEQSYGGVDGDSASAGELVALLSAISRVPIRQALAITGSVDQRGRIQAIGGVNEKVEGFFEVCRARGLTGEQGVVVPRSNVQHLMLREDVVAAVEAGEFHVHAAETIDQALELLTGMPAGRPDAGGRFPEGTFNGRVQARLEELARTRREFAPVPGRPDPGSP